MRLITYTSGPGGAARTGVRVGHRVLDIENGSRVEGQPLPAGMKALLTQGRGAMSRVQALAKAAQSSAGRYSGSMLEERAIRFMPPLADAQRFVWLADNFVDGTTAREPRFVPMDASRLAGHNAKAALRADGEAEVFPQLVYVVGRAMEKADIDEALDCAWAVTLLGPGGALGPEIVTLDEIADADDLWITCAVNGTETLRWNTRDQVWKSSEMLSRVSHEHALEPGDMVATGAPRWKEGLKSGDVVECAIEGVTALRVVMGPAENG
jgi:2-keto-4-pentenoate hydratase/2-oxohepta-3-ene-1,7-dioic acid hydratase in catechol pathway